MMLAAAHRDLARRAAVLLALLAPTARAGDAATLEILGFSRDGSRFAFAQHGILDGSGAAYAQVFVLDVARNAFAAPPALEGRPEAYGDPLARVRARALARAEPALRRAGIVRGLTGRVAARAATAGARRLEFALRGRAQVLSLAVRPLPDRPECPETGLALLDLRLVVGGRTRVLQRDERLPASRGCAFAYALDRALVQGSGLAVMVRVFRKGFEGPDVRWIAVTARLP